MYCAITNNGVTVNITPYIAYQGWKPSRNDVDGPNAGRNIVGTMIRDLVTTKRRIDVTCIPMPAETMRTLLSILDSDSFTVTYDDVQYGRVSKRMYANNYSWQYCQKYPNSELYFGFAFPLIEI